MIEDIYNFFIENFNPIVLYKFNDGNFLQADNSFIPNNNMKIKFIINNKIKIMVLAAARLDILFDFFLCSLYNQETLDILDLLLIQFKKQRFLIKFINCNEIIYERNCVFIDKTIKTNFFVSFAFIDKNSEFNYIDAKILFLFIDYDKIEEYSRKIELNSVDILILSDHGYGKTLKYFPNIKILIIHLSDIFIINENFYNDRQIKKIKQYNFQSLLNQKLIKNANK